MHTQSLNDNWQFREAGTDEWLPAQVPGSVHTDLLALERIPDPFVGDNERRVQWVAERDWEYRCTFEVAPRLLDEDRVFLVCDGLDTLASVPRLDKKWEEVEVELRAKQAELSSGCVYYERCPVTDKDVGCDRYRPTLLEAASDHFVACFRYAEEG